MADRSLIEWNPVTGCSPVSDGCTNCYASRMAKRFPHLHGTFDATMPGQLIPQRGRFLFSEIQFHPSRLDQPLRWKKPRRIFVGSMTDFGHGDVRHDEVSSVFDITRRANWHTYMFLTKRPQKMKWHWLRWINDSMCADVPSNVWHGVTVEDPNYKERIDILREMHAEKRFISFEPLLADVGEINFTEINWCIVGGESGPGARPMHPDWPRYLRNQCQAAGVPFFFKGWGTRMMRKSDPGYMKIDGREWKEFPR